MTPTQEIESWVREHGSMRDALNVAIARLKAQEADVRLARAVRKAVKRNFDNDELADVIFKVMLKEQNALAAEQQQPCGHPASAIVSSDEGTHYCADCAHAEQEGDDA